MWELVKVWEKEEERRARARNGKTKAPSKIKDEVSAPTEVWADVRYTNEFCMAKLEGYPYWPAKKCEARDEELKSSLLKSGRTLVALVGEGGGLRVVRLEDIRPFTGEQIDKEAVDEQPKNIRSQLDEVGDLYHSYLPVTCLGSLSYGHYFFASLVHGDGPSYCSRSEEECWQSWPTELSRRKENGNVEEQSA